MPCFHPIPALQDGRKVTLHPRPADQANLQLPCGGCIGCKTRKAQEWAARCVHEARHHESNIFVTLTYAPEHLPASGDLVPRDLTLFLKRLRQAMARRRSAGAQNVALRGTRLRYLAAGEYGDQFGRPHYHALLFGLGCDDASLVRGGDKPLYDSPTLRALWGKGTANFGAVTSASAAYTAGYTMKSLGRSHCDADGVVKVSPFMRCSTHPGIGADYVRRYSGDFRSGTLVTDGTPRGIPRYYKKVLEREFPDIAEEAAFAAHTEQCQRVLRDPLGASPDRLVAGEAIMKRRQELTRSHSL